ncbi:hypothetical protein D1614_07325 [Maribellus luteus]|uniref:Uncharacterized protein n=1 Tax=Maribellus luteus TaxID=2305463 RepID=A0A399T0L9_9BACT|nr:hypothetical protein D1614_07325 [Maribellus luteus]
MHNRWCEHAVNLPATTFNKNMLYMPEKMISFFSLQLFPVAVCFFLFSVSAHGVGFEFYYYLGDSGVVLYFVYEGNAMKSRTSEG